jgi:histidinol dehydrogenase
VRRRCCCAPDEAYLDAVEQAMRECLPTLPRAGIIEASLARRGALVRVRDLAEAVAISNRLAPEHLELAVADPEALLDDIDAAGAIFMGAYSCEALGDYCAGPQPRAAHGGLGALLFAPGGLRFSRSAVP